MKSLSSQSGVKHDSSPLHTWPIVAWSGRACQSVSFRRLQKLLDAIIVGRILIPTSERCGLMLWWSNKHFIWHMLKPLAYCDFVIFTRCFMYWFVECRIFPNHKDSQHLYDILRLDKGSQWKCLGQASHSLIAKFGSSIPSSSPHVKVFFPNCS